MKPQVVTVLFSLTVLASAIWANPEYPGRSKRGAVWQQGATTTILAAIAIPVDIEYPHAYVAINYAANYMNPQNVSYFTQPFNRFHDKSKRDAPINPEGPISRSSFYKTVIKELNRYGMNGKMCLLSTICEINSSPIHTNNGVLGSILQMMFSPSSSQTETGLPGKFYEAESAGREDNCIRYKSKCPLNILDLITNVH